MDWNKKLRGKYVVVRGDVGVYAGTLIDVEGKKVVLGDCMCLWKMSGYASLNQLAEEGVKCPEDSKFSIEVPEMYFTNIIQIIPVSEKAKANLQAVKKWKI